MVQLGMLLEQNPHADKILTIQDDTEFVPRTREFLAGEPWPEKCGMLSLYTPAHYATIYNLTNSSGEVFSTHPNRTAAEFRAGPKDKVTAIPRRSGQFEIKTGRH